MVALGLLLGPLLGTVAANPQWADYPVQDAMPNKVRPGDPLMARAGPDGATTIWYQHAHGGSTSLHVQAGRPEPRTVHAATAGPSLRIDHFVALDRASVRVTTEGDVWVGVLPHGLLQESAAPSLRLGCRDHFQAVLWAPEGATGFHVRQDPTMQRVRVVDLPATLLWERWGEAAAGDRDASFPVLVLVDAPDGRGCSGDALLEARGQVTTGAAVTGGAVVAVLVLASGGLGWWLWRLGAPNIPKRGSGSRPG